MKLKINAQQMKSAVDLGCGAKKISGTSVLDVPSFRTDKATLKLVHELEVHQIELEMQNKELQQARDDVESALERYTDLYDFAPVGYLVLDRSAVITAVNLTGAALLKTERAQLFGRHFMQFISEKYRSDFNEYFEKVYTCQGKVSCELSLLDKGNMPRFVQLETKVTASDQSCRLAIIDISGRKQAEAALLDIEERLYKLAETAVDAIIMLDNSGAVTFCNTAAEKMFGFTVSEIIGLDFLRLFIPEQHLGAEAKDFTLFKGPGTGPLIGRRTEVQARRKDGSEFTMELSISSIKVDGMWNAIGIMRDVTERKRQEMESQDNREYAENIVETVREPLVVLDSDLKILTANCSFYTTFKVTPEETVGNFIYDLGNRQWDIPRLRVLFEKILPKDTVINGYEVEHNFPSIGRKTILLNARQIFRENIGSHVILLAMEDITNRKLAEERIREVMRQQQVILDNIPNIAWLKDKEGRYAAVNEPFCKALGVIQQDLVGKSDYDIYPPELADKYHKNFNEVIASGTRTYYEEYVVDRDGNVTFVEKIKTPIFNDNGVVIGIIGIAHDITTRKEIEVTLRHDSTHDALTGLYNRAFFDEEFERFAQSRMFPVSIVMADVNGLKAVNDTMGHEAGDALIRLVAHIIMKEFRAEDIVARIGGDEIAVLLPATDYHVVEEVIRRIKSHPEIVDGSVSIAFGIATAWKKELLAETKKLSDERMYLDKTAQRKNKKCVAGHGDERSHV